MQSIRTAETAKESNSHGFIPSARTQIGSVLGAGRGAQPVAVPFLCGIAFAYALHPVCAGPAESFQMCIRDRSDCMCFDLSYRRAVSTPAGSTISRGDSPGDFHYPGGTARHGHHCDGAGRAAHGKEKCVDSQIARSRNSGQRHRHLF